MSEHDIVLNLAGIVFLGVGAQWLAWRLRLPSILLLLLFGLGAGPGAMLVGGSRLVDPDGLFPGLLLPLTSFAVGLILFEGGMTLRLREMREVGGVLTRLVSVGALVTWLLGSGAAYALGLANAKVALVLGAILVVTGPTVVGPLLRHIRPTGHAGVLLKWEGIVIDPIGATLALLVFEAALGGKLQEGVVHAVVGFAKTAAVGGAFGLAAGYLVVIPYRRHWVPDHLEAPVAFMIVIASFAVSNMVQEEAGLLTTTVMGLVIGNLLGEEAKPILRFKETLQVLLISVLFIALSARLSPEHLTSAIGWRAIVFVFVLVLVVRPLSVLISTWGSSLSSRERALMAWMAPRGIVAAAVASVFGLRLAEHGQAGGDELASLTFVVIIGTVALYGLSGARVARWLGLSEANPQGLVVLGADEVARELATGLESLGIATRLVDTSRANVLKAHMLGLEAVHGNVLSLHGHEELDLAGMGRFLALTPNREVNTLAAARFLESFGRANVFQLSSKLESTPQSDHEGQVRARTLFAQGVNHETLQARLHAGAQIKGTPITEAFTFESWKELYGEKALPLFVISSTGDVEVWAVDNPPAPQAGDTLVGLVSEPEADPVPAEETPAEETPAEEIPAEEIPAEEAASQESAVEEG